MTFEPLQPMEDPERSAARQSPAGAGRMLTQMRADEREVYLEDLAHQVSPGIDMYLFAALAGLLIGVGFRFDQLALLIAAVLAAPPHRPGGGDGAGGGLRFAALFWTTAGRPPAGGASGGVRGRAGR